MPRGARNPVEAAGANPIPFKKVGDMLVPEGRFQIYLCNVHQFDLFLQCKHECNEVCMSVCFDT